MDDQTSGAVKAPLEAPVRPAVAVAHGSDMHLTLVGAPWHLNLLTGQDRADWLAFGRACMEAERERCAAVCEGVREAADHAARDGHRKTGAMASAALCAKLIRA